MEEHLAKEGRMKEELNVLQKHCCSCQDPNVKHLKARRMGFAKTFQIYFMIAFHRNL